MHATAPLAHHGMARPPRRAARARYAERLAAAHDGEHLGKFEELLEAAIDLDRVPDEYLIAASYDPQLQARPDLHLNSTLTVSLPLRPARGYLRRCCPRAFCLACWACGGLAAPSAGAGGGFGRGEPVQM